MSQFRPTPPRFALRLPLTSPPNDSFPGIPVTAVGRKRKSMVSSPGQAKKANWGARPAVPDTAKGLFSTILFKTRASLPHRLLLFSTFPVTNVA